MAAVLQYPLAKVCQVTAKLLFESCFVGYFPSVVRMRTICNRTLDLLGFCHEDGLPSHLICVVRNSATKHIQCDGTPFLPAVGRIQQLPPRIGTSKSQAAIYSKLHMGVLEGRDQLGLLFVSSLMAASHGPKKVLKGAW